MGGLAGWDQLGFMDLLDGSDGVHLLGMLNAQRSVPNKFTINVDISADLIVSPKVRCNLGSAVCISIHVHEHELRYEFANAYKKCLPIHPPNSRFSKIHGEYVVVHEWRSSTTPHDRARTRLPDLAPAPRFLLSLGWKSDHSRRFQAIDGELN